MTPSQEETVLRRYLDTPNGQIHYVTAGTGRPVLLLHQTPRSWDEYRDVIPILARERWVVAMDTIGYGESYKPPGRSDIEDYARGAIALLDGLGIGSTAVVGHHTGAVVAMELAAAYPERVERLVLSACPYVDASDRDRRHRTGGHRVDHVEPKPDGTHVAELWQIRQAFYPKERPDLLTRFLADALRAGEKIREGHGACSRYHMEEKIGRVQCPTLVTWGTDDRFASPQAEIVAGHISGSRLAPIVGGTVAVVDEMPEAFARLVLDFLRG